jgi:parvulin-like peptidyl-prolyl isomerase
MGKCWLPTEGDILRRIISCVVFGLLLPVLAACGGAQSTSNTNAAVIVSTQPPTPERNPLPVNVQGQSVVARVNDAEITQQQFQRALLRTQQVGIIADAAALNVSVLDSLIEQKLIEQAAADLNVTITDAQVDAELNTSKALVTDTVAWEKWLSDNLYTEEEFRESLRASLIANAVLAQVTGNLPEDVLQVHARHILVESEGEATDILNRLQSGEDFAALAAAHSRDITTRERGGDLGWFIDGQLLEPALTQVAFAIEPGQMAGPVATSLGYHIVEVLERDERPLPEERRPLLVQITFENWLDGLAYNADIERYLTL